MRTRLHALVAALALIAAACGGGNDGPLSSPSIGAAGTPSTGPDSDLAVEAGAPFPARRCEANEAAGTITFLTGSDFAAAASIIDVVSADAAGYYEELCLDVEIHPGFTADNYTAIASGAAQFASGGSFSDVVAFSADNDADLLAITVDGHSAIDTLIVKSGKATELSDLAGTAIGVEGELPASIDVMMRDAGLTAGEDFDTVALDGPGPVDHLTDESIAAIVGRKSHEVGVLEQAGIGVQRFDPLDFGVPGSFGVIFTGASFVAEHPTAAQDFVRATTSGLADAIADPDGAAEIAIDLIESGGNPESLSADGELFRWTTEAQLIMDGTPEGWGLGVPDPIALQNEVDAYAEVGVFGASATPSATDFIAEDLAAGVYDDGAMVVWPG